MNRDQQKICERNLFAAYVDGELDTDLTLLFEDHLEGCAECRAELRAHRLLVCELDAAMSESAEIPVPDNFSRMDAARAAKMIGIAALWGSPEKDQLQKKDVLLVQVPGDLRQFLL